MCPAMTQIHLVCINDELTMTNEIRIVGHGDPIGQCPVPPTPPASKPVTQNFEAPGSGRVDILVVLDTTGSMTPELDKLAPRFKNLVSKLQNVDWQIAVTNAGATPNGFFDTWMMKGKFMKFQGQPQEKKILSWRDSNVDLYFQKTVGRADDGNAHPCDLQPYCMNPKPEPLKAVKMAIDQRATENIGFFRKDAYLVPLIISDADEKENGTGMQAQELLSHFNANLAGQMKGLINLGIIIQPGDKKCFDSNNTFWGGQNGSGGHYGTVVDQLSKLTNGLTMSLCDTDYGPGLSQISDKVRENMSLFQLDADPLNGELEVKVTPATDATWTLQGRRLVFSKVLPIGSKISVTYHVPGK